MHTDESLHMGARPKATMDGRTAGRNEKWTELETTTELRKTMGPRHWLTNRGRQTVERRESMVGVSMRDETTTEFIQR